MNPTIGLFSGGQLIAKKRPNESLSSVQGLAVAIQELMQSAEVSELVGESDAFTTLEWIVTTVGPGSFTGLRVGLATVKALAFALKIPVVEVDTLEAIAVGAATESEREEPLVVVPVINAFRKQVFSATWLFSERQRRCVVPSHVRDASVWIENPASQDLEKEQPIWVAGPGLSNYEPSPGVWRIASQTVWEPSVEAVAAIGAEKAKLEEFVEPANLTPNYLRKSAAEEQKQPLKRS